MDQLGLEVVLEVEARRKPEHEGDGEGSGAHELAQESGYTRLHDDRQGQVTHHAGNEQARSRRNPGSTVVAHQQPGDQQELAGRGKAKGLGERQRHSTMVLAARMTDYVGRRCSFWR